MEGGGSAVDAGGGEEEAAAAQSFDEWLAKEKEKDVNENPVSNTKYRI